MAKDIGLLTTDDLRSPMSEVRCPSAKCRATGKMPAVPVPSGHEGGGGYLRHARTRHGASVRGYTRRRFRCRFMPLQWRHLRFTVQRRWSPKEDGRYYSTSFYDLSIPPRGALDLVDCFYPISVLHFAENFAALTA